MFLHGNIHTFCLINRFIQMNEHFLNGVIRKEIKLTPMTSSNVQISMLDINANEHVSLDNVTFVHFCITFLDFLLYIIYYIYLKIILLLLY